uniref:Protein TIC 214 n=1 Tax=Hypericum ascyron TaxID=210378 RepID=A0A8K1JVZ6_9ROSI|nr:hypothetical chloroplast RF1 [Hypericum ascyron]UCU57587.1 hypothetical chloroplast RF1 [Hypericum ascyron]
MRLIKISSSWLVGNLLLVVIRFSNSFIVVGVFYGLITTFAMVGPSYLFFLRAWVIEDVEEQMENEKRQAARTGFIMGQMLLFSSIYYAPFHVALCRPTTVTVLALAYLLWYFFSNSQQTFLDSYGLTLRNEMNKKNLTILRNLTVVSIFINNLMWQLCNSFLLASVVLSRLLNIYMFRSNNKMLFLTSSFIGCLIGHFVFTKCVGLLFVWIQKNHPIPFHIIIQSNRYILDSLKSNQSISRYFRSDCVDFVVSQSMYFTLDFQNFVSAVIEEVNRILRIITLATCLVIVGAFSLRSYLRTDHSNWIRLRVKQESQNWEQSWAPLPQMGKSESKNVSQRDAESVNKHDKKEIEKKENANFLWFDKLITFSLFDYTRVRQPFIYIGTHDVPLEKMSEYSFSNCISDGNERISFMGSPHVSTFLQMIRRTISLLTSEEGALKLWEQRMNKKWNIDSTIRLSMKLRNIPLSLLRSEERRSIKLWKKRMKEKQKNITKEFSYRVKTLDKQSIGLNTLEKRTRLYRLYKDKKYVESLYDPLLGGPIRSNNNRVLFFNNKKLPISQNQIFFLIVVKFLQEYCEEYPHYFQGDFHFLKDFSKRFLKLQEEDERRITDLNKIELHNRNSIDFTTKTSIFHFFFTNCSFDVDFKNQRFIKNPIKKKEKVRIREMLRKKMLLHSYETMEDLLESLDIKMATRKKFYLLISDNVEDLLIEQAPTKYDWEVGQFDPFGWGEEKDTQFNQIRLEISKPEPKPFFGESLISGSLRAQQCKTAIGRLFQLRPHSLLFLDRTYLFLEKTVLYFARMIRKLINILVINRLSNLIYKEFITSIFQNQKKEFNILISDLSKDKDISDFDKKKKKEKKWQFESTAERKKRLVKLYEDTKTSTTSTRPIHFWETLPSLQLIRSCLLLINVFLRKKVLIPALILVKNIIRKLFFGTTEWAQDFEDLKKEVHIICDYSGDELPENFFDQQFLIENLFLQFTLGIQIKIVSPFRLKPSHRSNGEFPSNKISEKGLTKDYVCFLTFWGTEVPEPYDNFDTGSQLVLFQLTEPVLTELKKTIRKLKNQFLKKRKKNKKPLSKTNQRKKMKLRELDKLTEPKKEKDSLINTNNWMIYQFSTQMKDLADRTSQIKNQIEKITKKKNQKWLPSEKNRSSKKISNNAKEFQFKSSKKILQIVKRKKSRLVRQSNFFIKIWIERLYIEIFLDISKIARLGAQLVLESRRKPNYINKKMEKTNQNTLQFLSLIIKSLNRFLSLIRKSLNKDSKNVSDISQAYVFLKLSQIPIPNLSKLRSVLQYSGTSLFLNNEIKNKIKDLFGIQSLFHLELKDQNFPNSGMNPWKNWLRSHSQYKSNFLQITRSKLKKRQNWRNRLNQRRMVQNKDLNTLDKLNLYAKDKLKKKKNDFETDSLSNSQENSKKYYNYNLLAYQFINYDNKKDLYSSPLQRSLLQVTNNKKLSYKTDHNKLFNVSILKNSISEHDILRLTRNYFDWGILDFCLRRKIDIDSWIHTGSAHKNEDLSFVPILKTNEVGGEGEGEGEDKSSNTKKNLFDWMGMNKEQNLTRGDFEFELWFFRKLFILFTLYNKNPWLIPKKSLVYETTNLDNQKPEILSMDEVYSFLMEQNELMHARSYGLRLRNKEIQAIIEEKLYPYKKQGKGGVSRNDLKVILNYPKDKETIFEKIMDNWRKEKTKITKEERLQLHKEKRESLKRLQLQKERRERAIRLKLEKIKRKNREK